MNSGMKLNNNFKAERVARQELVWMYLSRCHARASFSRVCYCNVTVELRGFHRLAFQMVSAALLFDTPFPL
jgi:hypothetical protein